MGKVRLNRLFREGSGCCLNVAVDHGFFAEPRFLTGIENMDGVVRTLVDAGPDAIQLTVGQAGLLQSIPGAAKPVLVLRADVANVYGPTIPSRLYSSMIGRAVEQAVRLDAACLVVNLFEIPGRPEVNEQCIDNILAVKPECDDMGMPLMIEPLVMRRDTEGEPYGVDGDLQRIMTLVRQAVELGADVIKADPTDNPADYHQVIEVARVPVLVRGGGRVSDREILSRTRALIDQGARGIVYGRNIVQHPDPSNMTKALLDVVHNGASADDAMQHLGPAAGT